MNVIWMPGIIVVICHYHWWKFENIAIISEKNKDYWRRMSSPSRLLEKTCEKTHHYPIASASWTFSHRLYCVHLNHFMTSWTIHHSHLPLSSMDPSLCKPEAFDRHKFGVVSLRLFFRCLNLIRCNRQNTWLIYFTIDFWHVLVEWSRPSRIFLLGCWRFRTEKLMTSRWPTTHVHNRIRTNVISQENVSSMWASFHIVKLTNFCLLAKK